MKTLALFFLLALPAVAANQVYIQFAGANASLNSGYTTSADSGGWKLYGTENSAPNSVPANWYVLHFVVDGVECAPSGGTHNNRLYGVGSLGGDTLEWYGKAIWYSGTGGVSTEGFQLWYRVFSATSSSYEASGAAPDVVTKSTNTIQFTNSSAYETQYFFHPPEAIWQGPNDPLNYTVTVPAGETVDAQFTKSLFDTQNWEVEELDYGWKLINGQVVNTGNPSDSYDNTGFAAPDSLFTNVNIPGAGATGSGSSSLTTAAQSSSTTVVTPAVGNGSAAGQGAQATAVDTTKYVWTSSGSLTSGLTYGQYQEGVDMLVNQLKTSGTGSTSTGSVDMSGVISAVNSVDSDVNGSPVSATPFPSSSGATISAAQGAVDGSLSALPTAPTVTAPTSVSSMAFDLPLIPGHTFHVACDLSTYSTAIAIFRGIAVACCSVLFFFLTLEAVKGAFAGK